MGAWSPDGKYVVTWAGIPAVPLMICRNVTDFDQVLLILILKYLKKQNRMNEFYDIVNLPHLNKDGDPVQLILAWSTFTPIEQSYLKKEFEIDGR